MQNTKKDSVYFVTPVPEGHVGVSLEQTGTNTANMTVFQWNQDKNPLNTQYDSYSQHPLNDILIDGSKVTCTTKVVFWTVKISMELIATALNVTVSDAPAENGTTSYNVTEEQRKEIVTFLKNFVTI